MVVQFICSILNYGGFYMSETLVGTEQTAAEMPDSGSEDSIEFEPVCLEVPRIYDSCGAKDCLRDLTVFFTSENQELIDTATSVRITRVSVITATVDVDSVAFNRGYYSVDETFYFLCCCEVYTAAGALPTSITGIAVSSKRVMLYGSDGCVKRFSSDSTAVIDPVELDCCAGYNSSLPTANVQVSSPVALAASLVPVTTVPIVPFVPENVVDFIGGNLVAPVTQQVMTTIGLFSITTLSRSVQLMLPSYDFCMPRKECDDRTDDPCEAFSKIDFPTDAFFPPNSQDSDGNEASFDCRCG